MNLLESQTAMERIGLEESVRLTGLKPNMVGHSGQQLAKGTGRT